MEKVVARAHAIRSRISAVDSLAHSYQRHRDDTSPCSPLYGIQLYEQARAIRNALEKVRKRVDALFHDEARAALSCVCQSYRPPPEEEEAPLVMTRHEACLCTLQSDAIRERCLCSRERHDLDTGDVGGSCCRDAWARAILGWRNGVGKGRYLRLGTGAARPTAAAATEIVMIDLLPDTDYAEQEAALHCVTVSNIIAGVADEAMACIHAMIDVLSYNRMHHYPGNLGRHIRGVGRTLLRSLLCVDACVLYNSGAVFSEIIPEMEDMASALQNVVATVASWSPLQDCTAP